MHRFSRLICRRFTAQPDVCVRHAGRDGRDLPARGLLPHVQHARAQPVQNLRERHGPGELLQPLRLVQLFRVRVRVRPNLTAIYSWLLQLLQLVAWLVA